ncbi:MAG: hypothetical protein ACW99G_01165 [Candidatus Thorarchaeota archaeon]|jgi:hypothetical protein
MPTTTGTITANGQNVSATSLRDTVVTVLISGTYSNVELISEASLDDSIYFPFGIISEKTGIVVSESGLITNAVVAFHSPHAVRDITTYRMRAVSYGSGTVNITIITNKPLVEPAPLEELVYGQKNVTTAGTAVLLLPGSQTTHTLTITSDEDNTGNIYLGDSNVDSSNGYKIPVGGAISVDHNHALDNFYIDSDVNGDGVSYIGSIVSE